jgi:hypothetical protein
MKQWAARTLSSFLDACLITHPRRSLHIQVAAEAPLVHASEGWVAETWWWVWRCVTRSWCEYRACKRFSLPEWTAIMSRASSLLDSLSALEVRLLFVCVREMGCGRRYACLLDACLNTSSGRGLTPHLIPPRLYLNTAAGSGT